MRKRDHFNTVKNSKDRRTVPSSSTCKRKITVHEKKLFINYKTNTQSDVSLKPFSDMHS